MKISLAQLNMRVGDLEGNFNKIKKVIEDSISMTDIVVFSELAITGYPPHDLIERESFHTDQIFYLNKIKDLTKENDLAVVIGFFEKNETGVGKPFYNSLAFIYNGEIKCKYHKRLLPTYDIFDESRHFEAGDKTSVYEYKGIKLGFLICEDMWNDKAVAGNKFLYPVNPVKETVDQNSDIIISINASPSNVGKPEYRLEKFSNIVKNYKVPLLYVNQVGGNDDIIFDGTSFAVNEEGDIIYVFNSFEEQTKTFETFRHDGKVLLGYSSEKDAEEGNNIKSIDDKINNFYYKQIVLGIKDYVGKCGFKKAVVACSGGVDSALVLALAVKALGSENVVAITMPSKISSTGSVSDSEQLCKNLNVKLYHLPISKIFNEFMGEFENTFSESKRSLTKENLQARLRGTALMAFTNEFTEFIPLTTGNKSECAVGYCTIYGDMNGGLAPISDLYKTEVWKLCSFINEFEGNELIPVVIIVKEPSAELYEGQKDSDSLPPYDLLDAILIPYIEGNQINQKIVEDCRQKVKDSGYNQVNKIYKMVDRAEFKRRQSAPTIRIHQKAWGYGRRLPIVQNYNPLVLV